MSLNSDMVQSFRAGPEITIAQRKRGGASNRLCRRDLERYYRLVEAEARDLPFNDSELFILSIILGEMEFREPQSFRMIPSLVWEQMPAVILRDDVMSNNEMLDLADALPTKVQKLGMTALVALVDEVEKRQVAAGQVRDTKGFSKVRYATQEPVTVES